MPCRAHSVSACCVKCSAATTRLTTASAARLWKRRCWTRSRTGMPSLYVLSTHIVKRGQLELSRGDVQHISNGPLKNITAVATWYDKDGYGKDGIHQIRQRHQRLQPNP